MTGNRGTAILRHAACHDDGVSACGIALKTDLPRSLASEPLFARLAGQIAVSTDNEPEAARCFREAIRVAEETEPDVVQESSAPEAARQLAAACRNRGLLPQADPLEEMATQMEAGELGTPFDDAPTIQGGRGSP